MNTLTELTGDQLSGVLLQEPMISTLASDMPEVATGVHAMLDVVVTSLPTDVLFSVTPQDGMVFYGVVALWLLIIMWVIKDSTYRSNSVAFVIFSILLVTIATPLIGLPIYWAIRPIGYKYERAYWKAVMTQEYDEEDMQEEDQDD